MTQAQIKRDICDIGQTKIRHGQQFYSTSKESYPRAFKPGGTMLGLAPHMASRREDQGSDSKGRWTWVQLTGNQGKAILVITASGVSQTYPSEAGYSTVFMQQYRAYIKENVTNTKPKHRILLDLTNFITNWRSHHHNSSIIVMLDDNGDISDPHFSAFLADTVLHDVVTHHSPVLQNQSTYINGRKRLDYIQVSEDLLSSSTGAGHTPYGNPFISDHGWVYWDIITSSLFESTLLGPIRIPQKGSSTRPPSDSAGVHPIS